jgi:hypothetical protein
MTVRVVVVDPYQVCDNGIVFRPGDTAEVSQSVAEVWLASGWVKADESPLPVQPAVVTNTGTPVKKTAPAKKTTPKTKPPRGR